MSELPSEEPSCPRCGTKFIQVLDFIRGPHPEAKYVCHGCDKVYPPTSPVIGTRPLGGYPPLCERPALTAPPVLGHMHARVSDRRNSEAHGVNNPRKESLMTATDPETIKLSVEQEDVRYYAGVLDRIFAGLGRSSKDQQVVQLCSTDTNAPVLLIEVNGVILRFPFIPGWGTIDQVCPPAVIERHILEESRRRAGLVIGPGGRESGSLPRDDRPNSREHWVKIKYAGCPPWQKHKQKGFRIAAGKTHVQHNFPVSYEPIADPAVFDAKRGAAPALQEDVPASVLADLGLLAETVCPGVRMKFHTSHVEGERIYFFNLLYDGMVVADGRIDPDLTR